MGANVHITIVPKRKADDEEVREEALEALAKIEDIEEAQGQTGIFGKPHSRNYSVERGFKRGAKLREEE